MKTYVELFWKKLYSCLPALTYSFKMCLLILFSAIISSILLLQALSLQKPLLKTLYQQRSAAAYYGALAEAVKVVVTPNTDAVTFTNAITHLKQQQQELFDNNLANKIEATQQLAVFSNELQILNNSEPFSKNIIITALKDMLNLAIDLIILDQALPLGSDIPTHRLATALYHKQQPTADLTSETLTEQIVIAERLIQLIDEQINILRLRQYMGSAIVILSLAFVIGFSSIRLIRTPLVDFQKIAFQLTQGNLHQRASVDSNDEVAKICQAFNLTADLLEQTVLRTSAVTHRLKETITTIASSAKIFGHNFSEQDKTIAQIALNTNEITTISQKVVDTILGVQQFANDTQDFATTGQASIKDLEIILTKTAAVARPMVVALAELQTQVQGIRAIIDTIVHIADQASLLAINTALIAHSRNQVGFGAIAAKIDDLANKAAVITMQMEKIIQSLLNTLAKAGMQVEDLSQGIALHSHHASAIIEQLRQMIAVATHQIATFQHVHLQIHQHKSDAENIRSTITLLAQSAKATSRSMNTLYAHVNYLKDAAQNLQTILENFDIRRPFV